MHGRLDSHSGKRRSNINSPTAANTAYTMGVRRMKRSEISPAAMAIPHGPRRNSTIPPRPRDAHAEAFAERAQHKGTPMLPQFGNIKAGRKSGKPARVTRK